jgi:uncharacterized protein DUF1579
MSRLIVRLAFVGAVLVATPAARAEEPPKPGPEHQKLAYFAGTWTSDGELKANPVMPAGKYTSKDECQWFKGGFALKCDSKGTGPTGPMESASFVGYNAEEKVYTVYGIDSTGMVPSTVAKGSVQGDTWVFTDESKMGGKMVKTRYTMKQLTPTSYTFKWEMQGEGGAWSTVMEGKSTKAQ